MAILVCVVVWLCGFVWFSVECVVGWLGCVVGGMVRCVDVSVLFVSF